MKTIFEEPIVWTQVFEMWEEWASGPDDMELPEIYMDNSHVRTQVRAVSRILLDSEYDDIGLKLDELDYELSKCESAIDLRLRLPEIKQVLLEAQAAAEKLNVSEQEPMAIKGKRFKPGRNKGTWKDIKQYLFGLYQEYQPHSFRAFWSVVKRHVGHETGFGEMVIQEIEEDNEDISSESDVLIYYKDSKGRHVEKPLTKKQVRNYFTDYRKKEKSDL